MSHYEGGRLWYSEEGVWVSHLDTLLRARPTCGSVDEDQQDWMVDMYENGEELGELCPRRRQRSDSKRI